MLNWLKVNKISLTNAITLGVKKTLQLKVKALSKLLSDGASVLIESGYKSLSQFVMNSQTMLIII